jgi:hypothetical protein
MPAGSAAVGGHDPHFLDRLKIDPRRARHARLEHSIGAMVEPLGRVVQVTSPAQNVPGEVVGQDVIACSNPAEPG